MEINISDTRLETASTRHTQDSPPGNSKSTVATTGTATQREKSAAVVPPIRTGTQAMSFSARTVNQDINRHVGESLDQSASAPKTGPSSGTSSVASVFFARQSASDLIVSYRSKECRDDG